MAHLARVSRDLIYKVEAGQAVRLEKLHLIAAVLEERSKQPFKRESEITNSNHRA